MGISGNWSIRSADSSYPVTSPTVRAIVQARMTSKRFPGKVLAPFHGRPILAHVVERLSTVLPDAIVIATSTDSSDDPVDSYGRALGVPVFRGSLDNVVSRFQCCLEAYPSEWFLRVCADSPLLDPTLVSQLVEQIGPEVDLVTNTFPRTFPKGLSLELVRVRAFNEIDATQITSEEREHVTKYLYDNQGRFRIVNVLSPEPAPSSVSLAVDTVEDLLALEQSVGVAR